MPVITSAVVAVSAAALSMGAVAAGVATVATVATIGAVVGGIGLAVGVVGAITKNKDLIKVGTIMGALGAGAGLGAMAAGALGMGASTAANVGAQAGAEAGKTAATTVATETGKAGTVTAGGDLISQSTSSASSFINPTVGTSVTGGLQAAPGAAIPAAGAPSSSTALNAVNAAGQAGSQIVGTPGVDAPATPVAPVASNAGTQAPGAMQANRLGIEVPTYQAKNFSVPDSPVQADKGFFNSLDPSSKVMMGMVGGQMATGLIGGITGNSLQGKVAEQNLAFQKEQADRDQAQRELVNKNSAYAPLVTYNRQTGLIGRV